MNILVDAHQLGRRETGNETWIRNVVASLARVAVSERLSYAVTTDGVPELHELTAAPSHLVSSQNGVRLAVDLPRLARQLRADAVLSTYAIPATTTPCVVFVHDLCLEDPRAAQWFPVAMRVTHRFAIRQSCRRAVHVLVPSEHTRRDVITKLGVAPARVSVAGGAPDQNLAGLVARARPNRAGPAFSILTVGNIVPRKNLVMLAVAIRRCLDAGLAMRWRIVGQIGPEGHASAAAIRSLLGPAVSISGYVRPDQLAAEYVSADVLCFPSLFEGFGLPVAEAMAAGLPVVTSDQTSLPEVVGDAGICLSASDSAAWSRVLRHLHESAGLRESLRRAGRQRAAQWSWDRTATFALEALCRAARHGEGTAAARAVRIIPRGNCSVAGPQATGDNRLT